ncbi:hypothetical protein [Isoptericola sp. NPDC056134]
MMPAPGPAAEPVGDGTQVTSAWGAAAPLGAQDTTFATELTSP